MTYDRLGRRTPAPQDAAPALEKEAGGEQRGQRVPVAAPNAARLANPRMNRDGAAGLSAAASKRGSGRRHASLRILPVTAFVAALVLSVKVADLWEQRDGLAEAVTVGSPAVAQDAVGGANEDVSTPISDAAPVQLAQAGGSTGGTGSDNRVDPFDLGKSQIELLQSLAERRQELEERERALIQREGLLAAAEHRIEQKITELGEIKSEIEALIKTYDEQEEEQLSGLVKIYETMKPKDAARIFDELDMEVLLQVIERMKASKTAPVLANMTPERAKEVTSRIAERRQMPDIN